MIKIFLPDDPMNIERKYTFTVMLKNILGLEVEFFHIKKLKKYISNYIIKQNYVYLLTEKNNLICMVDFFFYRFKTPLEYLKSKYIPKVRYIKKYNDMPVFFSKYNFSFEKIEQFEHIDQTDRPNINIFTIDIDICAIVFFMLTRWEEFVLATEHPQKLDSFNRFPFSESLAFKNNFLHRPIVNEYTELLWSLLKKAGSNQIPKRQGFKIIPTHDIDSIKFPCSLKSLAGDILKRKNLELFLNRLKIKAKIIKNPYDNFSNLMDVSEKAGLQSHFYFMACKKGIYQNGYNLNNNKLKQTFSEILKRGHIIGFHPGFNTEINLDLFNNEKNRLSKITANNINEGRQHYLLFKAPFTWNIWEKSGLKIDSTLGYSKHEGFRCGTGCIYPVFDFINKKILSLKERPLIIMDGTLAKHKNLSIKESLNIIEYYCNISKNFDMPFTILFHNSSLNKLIEPWKYWHGVYSAFMQGLK